jgi:hypothetical protein
MPTILLAFIEALVFFCVPYLAAYIRWGWAIFDALGRLWPRALLFAAVLLVFMAANGLYRTGARVNRIDILLRIATSVLAGTAALIVIPYFIDKPNLHIGGWLLALSAILAFVSASLVRYLSLRFA